MKYNFLPNCRLLIRVSIMSLSLLLFYNAVTHAAPLRIMALGDSITAGYTDNTAWTVPFAFGYRDNLYVKLKDAGYSFDFVGGSTEPWTYYVPPTTVAGVDLRSLGQDNHRGYGGVGISTISTNIANWLNTDNPDVILLMIGINDIAKGNSGNPTGLESSLDSLVHNIASTKPNTHLIVAQITPYAVYTDSIVQYNDYIANTLVPTCVSQGLNVSMVNQYGNLLTGGVIDPSLFSNGINHPNEIAYESMAQTWFEGIEALSLHSGEGEASLVVNGGFETPTLSNDTISYQPVGTDWNYEGCAGMGRGNVFGSNAPNSAPFEGLQMAFLQGDLGNNKCTPAPDGVSKLQQNVSGFEVGKSYVLSFNAMGIDGFDGCDPFYVSIGGTDLFGLITPGMEYEEYVSEPFIATSETMNLLFYDQGNITVRHFTWIDDIVIQPISVPEPGVFSILISGIMAMLALMGVGIKTWRKIGDDG